MKLRLRLSIRMLGSIIIAAGLVFYIALQIIGQNFKANASLETRQVNDNLAMEYAAYVKTTLEKSFYQIRYYSHFVQSCALSQYSSQRLFYNNTLKQIAQNDTNLLAVWDSWELKFTDSKWSENYGRVSHIFYRTQDNQLAYKSDSLDLFGDNYDSFYYLYKLLPEEAITDPYKPDYANLENRTMAVSLVAPLIYNDTFTGLAGADISLENFQHTISFISEKYGFNATLFSFNGDIIAHTDQAMVGQNLVVADTFLTSRYQMLDRIQSGEHSSFLIQDILGKDSAYFSIASFKIANTTTPWALMIQAPLKVINTKVDETLAFVKQIELVGLLIMSVIVLLFALSIALPLQRSRNVLKKLAQGNVHGIKHLNDTRHDEIGDISRSINLVSTGLEKVTRFAENIGRGNFDYEFTQLSKNDILGNAVLDMRNSLRKAKIEEQAREVEEKQLEWTSQGINLFNRVLRVDNQNLQELSYEVIKALTLYMEAHMGGIYLHTSNADELELISFLGFSKEKYQKKYIPSGEGIVGRCMVEKETIFINDVPEEFAKITSGLGSSLPKAILVVPLISNQQLVGVLEIESIKEIYAYQIAFVERIAETIASTIAAVKTNVRTAELLDKAKKQAEELEQQEEEMRQNMEEMQATQEEASKREGELMALIKGFEKILPIIVYDLKGKITDINENYLKIYKGRKAQFIGKQHKADLFMNEAEQQKHNAFWEQINNGFVQESVEYIKSGKDEYWLKEKFIPVRDRYGLITKVLCIGFDITGLKKTESEIQQIQEGVITKKTIDTAETTKVKSNVIDINLSLDYIDLTYLKMVYKKDPSKIYNILKLYFDTLPGQIQEVEQLAKSRDFDKLKSKTNSLKTKMSYMGLKPIYENLREVEKLLAEQKNMNEIPGLLKKITTYWSLAHVELKKLLRIPG